MNLSGWFKLAEQHREVDFFYNQNKYSVSVSQLGKWYLTKYGDYVNAQEFDSFFELIVKSQIEDIPFKNICERFDIDVIY